MKSISTLSEKNKWVPATAAVLCWIMFFGFNYSRAALSLAIIGITFLALCTISLKTIWYNFRSDRFNILCALYFVSILITGFWSDHQKVWIESVLNALPFLVLPTGLLTIPWKDIRWMKLLIIGIMVLMSSGIIYSLSYFLIFFERFGLWHIHFESVPSMPEDYIRHTIGIAATLLLVIFSLKNNKTYHWSALHKTILWLTLALGVLHLHLQIAKTGLLAFYIIIGMLVFSALIQYSNWKWKIGLLAAATLFIVAFTKLPFFRQAVSTYDREMALLDSLTVENYKSTNSFLPRIVSYQIAGNIIATHPLRGVGIGDVKDEMIKGYDAILPDLHVSYRLIPHNQYIYNAVGMGIPLTLIGVCMLLAGIGTFSFWKPDYVYTASISFIYIILSLMEAVLVVQMSIFIYLFFILFFKYIRENKAVVHPASSG